MERQSTQKKKTSFDKDSWDNFKNELSFIKDTVDSKFLLESLGFKITKETSKELRAACIIHGGDNATSFRFNKVKRTWSCFSHACDDIYGKDIINLIKACKSCSFGEAVKFLKELTGYGSGIDSANVYEYKKQQDRRQFISDFNETAKTVKSKFLDEQILFKNRYVRSNYFINEGFSKETLDYFEISGGYVDLRNVKRDVIPIRDVDGSLVGCSFSATIRDTKDKYLFPPDFDKDNVLYNLNKVTSIIENKPLIIVEGFKSVWRLYDMGIKNVVACMGTRVTEGQRSLIYTYAMAGVVLFLDNDGAGIEGALHSYFDLCRKIKTDIIFITEFDEDGKGLDPADLTKEQAYNYLSTYI